MNDDGVLRHSRLWENMNENTLNLPHPRPLLGRNNSMPYVFVADRASALKNKVMKPYPVAGGRSTGIRVLTSPMWLTARLSLWPIARIAAAVLYPHMTIMRILSNEMNLTFMAHENVCLVLSSSCRPLIPEALSGQLQQWRDGRTSRHVVLVPVTKAYPV
ncbi:hypothetical protein EVAR_65898_1 [Eumeta japonica]|uniref:Uncharacterized protein n=1 Tax=Eumeta variegata TaxID=151549 RepID=A0A4C2A1C1_EUMVA|nr:hypothetical protein EVAR_65898_1 [Eumeta japonica]